MKPHGGNSLTLTVDGHTTSEEVEPEVTSYGAQLAAFVAAVEQGGPVVIDSADSIATMTSSTPATARLEPRRAVPWSRTDTVLRRCASAT